MRSRFGLAVDGIVSLALAAVAGCSGSSADGVAAGSSSGTMTSSGGGGSSSSSGTLVIDSGIEVDAGPFPPFKDEASFQCGDLPPIIGGLKPGIPVDYLELRTTQPYGSVDGDAGAAPIPGKESTGSPCASKTCRDGLATVSAMGWAPSSGCAYPETQFLVFSRGNDSGAVGKDGVGTSLAPIDSLTTLEEQTGTDSCVCGRRFEGLASARSGGASLGVAEYLAEVAYLEAVSVIAFRRFEEELIRFRAPLTFVKRARESRADEIRHARTTAWLAKVHGGVVAPVEAPETHERTLFEIALENAVEGCVRETYGALVAAYQAKMAQDPEIRRAMQIIAIDEAKHAELAHDVACWLERQLTSEEREQIEAAKDEARRELERAASVPPCDDVRRLAGVPDPVAAGFLIAGITSLAEAA